MPGLGTIERGAPLGLSEADLVARAVAGDAEAFSTLESRHRQRVWSKARSILGSDAEADDACQETFILAYQRIHTLRDAASFWAWIAAIARNYCLDQRERKREQFASVEVDALPSTADAFARSQSRTELGSLIQELSPQKRVLAEMHYLQALDQDEIAHSLNLPLGTVSGQLARARDELRARVEHEQRRAARWAGDGPRVHTHGALTVSCPLCGRHLLEWRGARLPGGVNRFETFCPECSGDTATPMTQWESRRAGVGGAPSERLRLHTQEILEDARRVLRHDGKCPACSSALVHVPSHSSEYARTLREARVAWRCVRCRYSADNRLSAMLLGVDRVAQFWLDHQAVFEENTDRLIRVDGADCWRVHYRGTRRQGRLAVVATVASLDIVSCEIDHGYRAVVAAQRSPA